MRGAEFAQAAEAWKKDSFGIRAGAINVAFDKRANFLRVRVWRGFRLGRIEARVEEKLFGAADDDEAVMGVGGVRIVLARGHRAGFFVDEIFPNQLVAKRKG